MSARRAERRKRAIGSGEPDLTPIMNLTLMLIVALLTLSAALPLGLLSVQAPRLRPDDAADRRAAGDPQLNLTIVVTREGYDLVGTGWRLDGSFDTPPRPGEPLFPKVQEAGRETYDTRRLNRKLLEIKTHFPREQKVIITADEDVAYEDIVKTMDASRESADGRELFPAVAFSAGLVDESGTP